ncbi:putative transcription regulator IWS1 family [Lupinus albus]|uniref:Putative transcription regulator IWS1 family n=1 Tax=Lupinus albus TaxID=3870 RepID=A0A6A4PMY9_LUPAL|nr:putative transcription regulator IWS1 family [Lupinus albus]
MDLEDFRSIMESASVDVWLLMDAAIAVASIDNVDELKRRRDQIVERLYTATSAPPPCRNYETNNNEEIVKVEVEEEEEEELDPYGGLSDDEQKKILEIKQQLEYPNQSEESLMELLHTLADMDITFEELQDTDIGRHVNKLRKHSSNDVKKLVKLLVSKWKGIVDEWVKSKTLGEEVTNVMVDEDSPQQKTTQNGHHQSPEFAHSPNQHNGNSGSEVELKKAKAIPRKVAPPKPAYAPPSLRTSDPQNRQREHNLDSERLDYATKRLQENYKEAANAKKQRTIQVMDLHELPKPKNKNVFFAKK